MSYNKENALNVMKDKIVHKKEYTRLKIDIEKI